MIFFFFLLFDFRQKFTDSFSRVFDFVWKIQSTLDITLIGIIRFHRCEMVHSLHNIFYVFIKIKKTHRCHDLHLKTTKRFVENLLKNVSHAVYAQTFVQITILDKFPHKSQFKILMRIATIIPNLNFLIRPW